jgi:hypothetical protein
VCTHSSVSQQSESTTDFARFLPQLCSCEACLFMSLSHLLHITRIVCCLWRSIVTELKLCQLALFYLPWSCATFDPASMLSTLHLVMCRRQIWVCSKRHCANSAFPLTAHVFRSWQPFSHFFLRCCVAQSISTISKQSECFSLRGQAANRRLITVLLALSFRSCPSATTEV